MTKEPKPTLKMTRRAFGNGLIGAAAVVGHGGVDMASVAAKPVPHLSPDLRDAALRGLALAGYRGDPVTAASANAALDQLAETDPEAAILGRLYQLLDVRPAAYWPVDVPHAQESDLEVMHEAIRTCRPVRFGYTDLEGNETERKVLPLVLVHPPQGVKLLAWCAKREDFRQFFVREVNKPVLLKGDFRKNRLSLLEGLLDKESNGDWYYSC